ncbi:hypothetical protein [Oscillatoria salina]|uniref:hypothetical protein n=1 Tax=Oscillatoria salina TaxID=331517 RepID=UPI0013B6EAB9|nr:hypothetical protein [Oscillatoria salina]MBZ8178900.1 hypothetical protein [Oscillatoria salina IIICB1]NET86674.1 hypothetical protein [Kamptonema sp. SIO1D9]
MESKNSPDSRQCKRGFCFTIALFLIVETPQALAAWVTLSDFVPRFFAPKIEVVQPECQIGELE